MSSRLLDTS